MMLQFKQNSSNEFIIYANTISDINEEFGDFFLFGFRNGFTKEWVYVIPLVLVRNGRYIKFSIDTAPSIALDAPFNGIIYLDPTINWDYKVWNLETAVLDPTYGKLIDSGQMILEPEVKEISFSSYISGNESLKTWVYYTSNNIWNKIQGLWNYQEETCAVLKNIK